MTGATRPSRVVSAAAILATALVSACGESAGPPVATPSATINRPRAPLGSPIEVTYRFQVAPGAGLDGAYRVMVHFVDVDDELMWTDDHDPPTPTSSWQAGGVIEYTRTVFIPVYPYLGETRVLVGLYDPDTQRRLTLAGEEDGQQAYRVATLELQPQSESIFVVYGPGWHPPEVSADNSLVEWRWSKKTATVSFRNPGRDVLVYLDLDGRPDVVDAPQQVSLRIAGQVVDAFTLDTNDRVLHQARVGADLLGSADVVELSLEVDQAFVPARTPGAGPDERELGVRVFHLYVEAR